MRSNLFTAALCCSVVASALVGCGGGGGYGSSGDAVVSTDRDAPSTPEVSAETTNREPDANAYEERREAEPIAENPVNADPTETAQQPAESPAQNAPAPSNRPRVVTAVLGARNRNTASSNARQLALAMMQNDRLPAQAIYSDEGTPLLSWRVAILQTLDRNLYNAFNREVAWDHPDNQSLIAQMPSLFDAGYPLDEGHTVMMVVSGDDTMFPPNPKRGRGMSIGQCRDGTSKTVLFVVAHPSQAVPWTKPQDIEFNPDRPADGLAGPDETIIAAFCDGSVRRLSGLDDATIKAVLTASGGEVVGNLD